jgi:hypothetical protein
VEGRALRGEVEEVGLGVDERGKD